jgi:hypothetical protein
LREMTNPLCGSFTFPMWIKPLDSMGKTYAKNGTSSQ